MSWYPASPAPTPGPARPVVSAAAVAQLKEDLGLLNGKCGSSSTKSWPCPNKTKVDGELLPALVGLTRASPNLRQKLKELAETWHCGFHYDKDIRVGPRVELWLASFPSGNTTMAAVAPPASAGGSSKAPSYEPVLVPAQGGALLSPPTTPPKKNVHAPGGSVTTTKATNPYSTSSSPTPAKYSTAGPAPALPSSPATAYHHAQATTSGALASAAQREATAMRQLRARLGLDSRYCGSGKKDNPDGSCGRLSAGKDGEIDKLLMPLATLKLAGPDLADLLDQVAGKWHCHLHAWGHYKADRVAHWIKLFPITDVPVTATDVYKSASGLRNLLGLRCWTCGSYLKKCETNPDPLMGPRCGAQSMPYHKGDSHKAAVDEILKSLAGLTRASPGLWAELVTLAQKWHCKSHPGVVYAEDRAREWLALFPGGPPAAAITTTNPFDEAQMKIKELLCPLSPQCPVIAESTGKWCQKPIAGRNMRHCDNLADEIARLAVNLDDGKLKVSLELLDVVGRCSVHNNLDAVRVAQWQSQTRHITRNVPRAAAPVGPSSTPALQSLTEFEQDIYSRSTPSGYDESPLRIVDRSDVPRDHESNRQRGTSKWREPLTKEEHAVEWGFLYAYTVKGNPKYVKIGYTSRDVATRHIEWQTACDRQVTAAYPEVSKAAVLVPYPRRVEALCHAELEGCRVRVACGPCRVQHEEWFEVSEQEAIDVIEKWTEKMAKNYNKKH
ncbi:T5orf172 domain-containing protein [Podospora didyma]|uniref:T5orf172 domain-containing protein n=1 Tax=Podospora didyma TaxID=330526 RepID=A0AAE0U068_9PEZI|nr:T5orf172 domain-containing protein [Podospora didyma]